MEIHQWRWPSRTLYRQSIISLMLSLSVFLSFWNLSVRFYANLGNIDLIHIGTEQSKEVAVGFAQPSLLPSTLSESAYGFFERALQILPHDSPTIYGMSYLAFTLGRYEEAASFLSYATGRPGLMGLYLGLALEKMGRTADAIAVWREAHVDQYAREQANQMGGWYAARQRWREAVSAYNLALQIFPGDVRAHLELARTLLQGYQQSDLAQEHVVTALALLTIQNEPNEVELGWAYSSMGQLAVHRGEPDKALGWFERAAVLPNYPKRQLSLQAIRICHEKRELKCAQPWIERAVAAAPEDVTVWRAIGHMYRVAGELGQAIEAFRQVIVLQPTHIEPRFDLAALFLQDGQVEQAISEYRQILALDPGNQRARDEIERLDVQP